MERTIINQNVNAKKYFNKNLKNIGHVINLKRDPPRGGVPNHAFTQIFFRFHAEENKAFHAITQKSDQKQVFHVITQTIEGFHASRMHLVSRIHAEKN